MKVGFGVGLIGIYPRIVIKVMIIEEKIIDTKIPNTVPILELAFRRVTYFLIFFISLLQRVRLASISTYFAYVLTFE